MWNRIRRQPRQLVLDGLFVALLLHFFVTGQVVPSAFVELFRVQPQIVVSTEPELTPDDVPGTSPVIEDGDLLPETHHRGAGIEAV